MHYEHEAVYAFEATGTTKTQLARAAVRLLIDKYREGGAQAMRVITIVAPGQEEKVNGIPFNLLNPIFLTKLVHMVMGLALHSINAFGCQRMKEYSNVLQSIHSIIH